MAKHETTPAAPAGDRPAGRAGKRARMETEQSATDPLEEDNSGRELDCAGDGLAAVVSAALALETACKKFAEAQRELYRWGGKHLPGEGLVLELGQLTSQALEMWRTFCPDLLESGAPDSHSRGVEEQRGAAPQSGDLGRYESAHRILTRRASMRSARSLGADG